MLEVVLWIVGGPNKWKSVNSKFGAQCLLVLQVILLQFHSYEKK
jgi:hypothetical protein